MNESKKKDHRSRKTWRDSGAITPHFSLEVMRDNPSLRMQCGMMLDGFPTNVLRSIEEARDSLDAITKVIAEQPVSMIDSHFDKVCDRKTRIKVISAFIHAFFAYRRTIGK